MTKTITLFAALCCASCSFAQKLPCSIDDINAALEVFERKVTPESQYLLIDVNDDGVKEVIFRDSDEGYASYAVLRVKGSELEVEDFTYDGFERLGYDSSGYSLHEHDEKMGGAGRTLTLEFTKYKKGKVVLTGGDTFTDYYDEDDNEEESESSCHINGETVDYETYRKHLPQKIVWFNEIEKGWRMVMTNEAVNKKNQP